MHENSEKKPLELRMIDEKINDYCIDHSAPTSSLSSELEKYTQENVYSPQMLIGKLEGQLLGMLIRLNEAKKVLEIGTYTGYSALIMAENLPDDGKITTIDINRKTIEIAKSYWDRSPHAHKIQSLEGKALDIIDDLPGPFDLVFIDADKANYKNYVLKTLDKLSSNGIIVLDNCLWSGKVLLDSHLIDEKEKNSTLGIKEVNSFVKEMDNIYQVMLPIRDGMYILKKKVY